MIMNDWGYKLLSILLPIICTILGWIIYRKTERIKIMENQLSDKKYKAYADIVSVFFGMLKDTKNDKRVDNKLIMDKIMDSKKDIFMYGSDTVFYAFNSYLTKSSKTPINQNEIMGAFLSFMLTIRQDMCGKQSKLSIRDILINLIQDESGVDKFISDMK
jgi:hypothetical protein